MSKKVIKKQVTHLLESIIISLILIVTLFFQIGYLDKCYGCYFDEGVYLESAKMITEGFLPYNDIFMSQPANFTIVLSSLIKIFGDNFAIGRIHSIIWSLVSIYMIYLISKKIHNTSTGIIAAILLAISPLFFENARLVEAEIPSIGASLVGIWLLMKYLKNSKQKSMKKTYLTLVFCGFFIGLSTSFKFTSIPLIPITAIYFIISKKYKETLIFLSAVSIPFLPWLFFDTSQIIIQNVIYHLDKMPNMTTLTKIKLIIMYFTSKTNILLTSGLGFIFLWHNKKGGNLINLFFLGSLALIIKNSSFDKRHITVIIPYMVIMTSIIISKLIKIIINNKFTMKSYQTWSIKMISIVILIMMGISIYDQIQQNDHKAAETRYNFKEIMDAARVLKNITSESDYIISDIPLIPFLAQRKVPPGLTDVCYKRFESGYLTTTDLIDNDRLYNVTAVALLGRRRYTYFDEYIQYVYENYEPIKEYNDNWGIYIKK